MTSTVLATLAAELPTGDLNRVDNRSPGKFIAAAGLGIIVLGAAAALSPTLDHVSATTLLGLLLAAAGLLEIFAGEAAA